MNPLDVLQLTIYATLDDVKKAHRQLVKKYHPDINKAPDAVEMFKKIQMAYEELIQPKGLSNAITAKKNSSRQFTKPINKPTPQQASKNPYQPPQSPEPSQYRPPRNPQRPPEPNPKHRKETFREYTRTVETEDPFKGSKIDPWPEVEVNYHTPRKDGSLQDLLECLYQNGNICGYDYYFGLVLENPFKNTWTGRLHVDFGISYTFAKDDKPATLTVDVFSGGSNSVSGKWIRNSEYKYTFVGSREDEEQLNHILTALSKSYRKYEEWQKQKNRIK